ncbi:MAG: DUF6528 family protein [Clostridium sp.]|nr:DUF6528 family protein [Clostridium sp.]
MNLTKIFCSSLAMLGCLLATGCSDDEENVIGEVGAKTSITLGRYYNATGSTLNLLWQGSDKAAMLVAGPGKSEAAYAAPITTGSASALFMFQVKASRNEESTVIGYYPSTADVTCVDGLVHYQVPTAQDGTISPLEIGYTTCKLTAYEGATLNLKQAYATLYVNVARGNYSVAKVEVSANGGGFLAGNVSLDPATGESTADASAVTVTPAQALSCVNESQMIPVLLAPVALESGYTVKITTTEGNVISKAYEEAITLESGERYNTDNVSDPKQRTVVFCGSNMVYMVEPSLISSGNYQSGVIWQWDATDIKDVLGLAAKRCNHLDDCKPVDQGKKLLCTSSYNWTVLLDIETKQPLFYSNQTPGAHSAELLPGNKVVVACSDNGDKLQIYDLSRSNEILFESELPSAHGVVWVDATQRLYAIGGQKLNIYILKDADTMTPSLELERSISTPQGGLHDLNIVDSNTLSVAGRRSYLYDIGANSFKEMTLFSGSTALKSMNYNAETGECWYTDSTVPEGTQTWSTQTIHYTKNVFDGPDDMTFKVPDIDVYKVRVLNW